MRVFALLAASFVLSTGASAGTSASSSRSSATASTTASTTGPTSTTGKTSDPSTTGEPTTADPSTTGDPTVSTTDPDDPCMGIDYTGYCDGDTLIWCEDNALKVVDCTADGRICVFEDAEIGYNCVAPPGDGNFGYPVGDKTTSPAGGWVVTQVLAHYYADYGGGHLAQDVAIGEAQTKNAPVYAVADGLVRYAGANASSYVNVVLIEHTYDGDQKICSFYGHLNAPSVSAGQQVQRGDPVATILDQQGNSHLHYVLLSPALCDASAQANGALICGYDGTPGPNGVEDLASEPAVYTALPNVCANQNYPDAFYSPSKFIDAHHF
jgi:hypothetical protein